MYTIHLMNGIHNFVILILFSTITPAILVRSSFFLRNVEVKNATIKPQPRVLITENMLFHINSGIEFIISVICIPYVLLSHICQPLTLTTLFRLITVLFLLPHPPSVPSTFFYPSLKLPYPPQSFGAGISESDEK